VKSSSTINVFMGLSFYEYSVFRVKNVPFFTVFFTA